LETADNDLTLAAQAADNIPQARRRVNALLHPVISYQTGRFCKRFCRENSSRYRCSLPTPWGNAPENASLCEWGNASYGWMLDDLTGSKRLRNYRGDDGSSLYNYLYQVANSLPFYERWKDWRFGRKVHVPTYIQDMGPTAAKIFLALRARQDIRSIVQGSGDKHIETEKLCQQIIIELTRRQKLHLLNPPKTVSVSHGTSDDPLGDDSIDMDIPVYDEPMEQQETRQRLQSAWQQLSPVEQFVVEALVIEQQEANAVLQALTKLNIRLKPEVEPQHTDRQQLYYFRRKTLVKLGGLMEAKQDD
jgi:hypothetical protein